MKDLYKTINYKGKDYKLAFNLNSMELIQEEYGTLDKWGDLTNNTPDHEVNIRALIFGFTAMLNEGIDIDNDENGTNLAHLTNKQVGRLITEIGIERATEQLHETVINSVGDEEKKLES